MAPPLIFVSYSSRNEREKDQLLTQLRVLEAAGKIDLWSDDRIDPGAQWKKEIDDALRAAHVGILLVTAEYLSSKFILQREVPAFIEGHAARGLTVFPLIAKDCAWTTVGWLSALQVRPRGGKPIWRAGGRYAAEELAKITRELAEILTKRAADDAPTAKIAAPRPVPPMMPLTADMPCNDACRSAIAAVSKSIGALEWDTTLRRMAGVMETAIQFGAPFYNKGNVVDCAHVYVQTARMLADSLSDASEHLMPAGLSLAEGDPASLRLLSGMRGMLVRAIARLDVRPELADSVAWSMRYAFDECIVMLHHGEAYIAAMAALRKAVPEQLPAKFAATLDLVLQIGLVLEHQGAARNRDWIESCDSVYAAAAAELILSVTDRPLTAKMVSAVNTLGATLLKAGEDSANLYRSAWLLQHALARARMHLKA